MRTISQDELKKMLDSHRKWVMNEPDGERANLRSANLSYANLRSANLSYANLSYASLSYADLRYASLSYADLSYADLSYADLSYASLSYANLSSANLSSADLSSANLSYASLSYASLSYAILSSADLRSANLSYVDLKEIKEDFFKVLKIAKDEAIGLYDALVRGKINGSQYSGECACLVGTVAKIRNENHQNLTIKLKPDAERMAEKWFLAIQEGDTPQNNPVSRIATEWVEEFMKKNDLIVPAYKLISSLEKPELFNQGETK